MITISLDENNNINLTNNNIVIKSDAKALLQDIKSLLLINKGENTFNTEQGIDYDNDILGKEGSEEYIKNLITNELLTNNEITNINKIELDYKDNVLNINNSINTIYGEIEL